MYISQFIAILIWRRGGLMINFNVYEVQIVCHTLKWDSVIANLCIKKNMNEEQVARNVTEFSRNFFTLYPGPDYTEHHVECRMSISHLCRYTLWKISSKLLTTMSSWIRRFNPTLQLQQIGQPTYPIQLGSVQDAIIISSSKLLESLKAKV